MKSIKKQLMLSILVTVCLSTAIMVGITYYVLKEELDELFDENMVQISHAIAVHDFSPDSVFLLNDEKKRRHLKGEEEFLIQIWSNKNLTYSSLPALELPYQGEGGVRTIIFDDQKWRYYGLSKDDWLIQVSQPIPVRHTVIWEIYYEILFPMFAQLPILLGIIWYLVGYGFKPLKQISVSIKQRSSTFLDKLSEDNVPQEISAIVRALNSLLEKLENSIKIQRRFTADAAHELRTPLTAVSLQLGILRRAKTEQERDDAIKELHKGVDRSTHLVLQLLELARQEPDAMQTVWEECDLQVLLQSLVEDYTALAQQKNIDLKIIAIEKAQIYGDKNALAIMIGNLINNAILYTQEGGKVYLYLSCNPNNITLNIADNGPGIPEDKKNRIFDRFYRLAGTKTNGSGLGLSIVKTIAERHGIRISLEDGLDGVGSTFKLIFTS